MQFPVISALTAGVLIVLQTLLSALISGQRRKTHIAIGDGGDEALQRATRRHGNLAEQAGLFIAGFTLLELSGQAPNLLAVLCTAYVLARISHAIGMSQTVTTNPGRMIGAIGSLVVGFVLGGTLVWVAVAAG